MDKPILLLKHELIKPIDQALDRIEEIRQRKINNVDSIILEGLFALGVSSFENSISDTLRILFTHIPDKLDIKSEIISKQYLINGEPLKHAIENKVNSVGYKNLEDILTYFSKATGIKEDVVTTEELNSLRELKATRNLLLHNNLIENSFYLETAGPNMRQPQGHRRRLEIDQNYLFESLVTLRTILSKFKTELLEKYSDYTKVNAIKKLFEFIFQTPIMKFENEFEVDEERDVIGVIKRDSSRRESLSHSERFYYDIWVAHSHGDEFQFKNGQFYGLSSKDKFGYFIKHLDLLKT
ncbi:MAG: hypothetical protein JXR11_12160 [Balneola sp.]